MDISARDNGDGSFEHLILTAQKGRNHCTRKLFWQCSKNKTILIFYGLFVIFKNQYYFSVKTSLAREASVKALKMKSMPKHVRPSVQINVLLVVWVAANVIFILGILY
jgi:hypothetical protein